MSGNHPKGCACCENGREVMDAKNEEMIAKYGFTMISVFGNDNENLPFTYTIGLADKGLKDLIVFGMPMEASAAILNIAANMSMEKPLSLDIPVDDIARCHLIFKEVSPNNAAEYIKMANARAGELLPAIQMIWPDANNVFPWEDGFEKKYEGRQPMLFSENSLNYKLH